MGLSGMFSAVAMATGWRPGPVKLSNPSESRSSGGGGGVAGTERQFQSLPRISSSLLLHSLVIALLFSPHQSAFLPWTRVRFPSLFSLFQTGTPLVQHAVQTVWGPSLPDQSRLWGRATSLLPDSKTRLHLRDHGRIVHASQRFPSVLPGHVCCINTEPRPRLRLRR